MIKFVADSSCDITEFPGVAFEAVPMTISTSEKEYIDDDSTDIHEMLDYLHSYKDRSYTACPSTEKWLAAFDGADEIYVVTLTSGLSGTYNSACLARNIYLESHPDAKIYVIDSLSTGPEIRMIIEKIIALKQSGKTFEEIQLAIPEYMKTSHLFFSLKSLHNMAQNGRVNKVLASAVGMLHISILGVASEKGTVEPISKCRGENSVISSIIKEMSKIGYHGGKVRICHIENEPLAEKIIEAIRKLYPLADVLSYPARALCSYYAERGGIILGFES